MTSLAHRAVEEHYQITDQETGITGRDVHSGERKDEWQDLWRYQVPVGVAYVFKPNHSFSVYAEYLQDAIDAALADDGGTITDETTEANEGTADDMTLMPATETTSDQYYFGYRYPFATLRLKIGTAGVGTAITWEYYNGASWVTIPGLVDGTSGFTATAGTNNITFVPPADWARVVIGDHELYYIRAQVSTASFTTVPTGDQAWIGATGVELMDNHDLFRIQIRDSSEESRRRILGPYRYRQVKEFQDVTKRATLSIGGEEVAKSGEWIVIEVLPKGGVVDVSQGYFQLEVQRIREGF